MSAVTLQPTSNTAPPPPPPPRKARTLSRHLFGIERLVMLSLV